MRTFLRHCGNMEPVTGKISGSRIHHIHHQGPGFLERLAYVERRAKSLVRERGPAGHIEAARDFQMPVHPVGLKQHLVPDPFQQRVASFFRLEVRKKKRSLAAHQFGVAFHHAKIRSDIRRKIDFVD